MEKMGRLKLIMKVIVSCSPKRKCVFLHTVNKLEAVL